MENYSIVIFILAVMICLSAMADRIKIPYPVLLIIAGIMVGFIPTLPDVEINPEVVFLIFLPPSIFPSKNSGPILIQLPRWPFHWFL